MIGLYAKALTGALLAAALVLQAGWSDGTIGADDITATALTLLGGFAVIWAVPNTPASVGRYGKAIVAGLVAVVPQGVLIIVGGNHWTVYLVLSIVVSFLLNTGLVSAVPNAASSDPIDPDTGHLVAISGTSKERLVPDGNHVVGENRTRGAWTGQVLTGPNLRLNRGGRIV